MLDDLEALNERIYELYGRLYENAELLTKKQSDYIADRLFEQYKKEYDILRLNAEPDRAAAQYRAEERSARLMPYSPCWFMRLFGKKKNEAAKLIEREVEKAVGQEFATRECALETLDTEEDARQETDTEETSTEIECVSAREEPAVNVEPQERGEAEEQGTEQSDSNSIENEQRAAQAEGRQGADGAAV